MNLDFKDLIWNQKNSLSEDFCKHLIKKFENDSSKEEGKIMLPNGEDGINRRIKISIDLGISQKEKWKEEDQILFNALSRGLGAYFDFCRAHHQMVPVLSSGIRDNGYQIQRTRPGEFYDWHHDFCIDSGLGARILTYIWYLNDVKEDGYTEFIDGTRIQPEMGKLIIFPATWTYFHRGFPPKSETKYICTGWVYSGE